MFSRLTTSTNRSLRNPWLVALVIVTAWACMGAQTYINLAEQVGASILAAANGGTGRATLTAHYTIVGNGTSTVSMVSPGTTSGWVYTSNGASSDPSFQAPAAALNFSEGEVPTGAVNGINQSFVLAHTPNPSSSLKFYVNGQ